MCYHDSDQLEELRQALIEGEESGVSETFDPDTFVMELNASLDANLVANLATKK